MKPAYYNEIDQYVAQWLRNLIAANLIAPGDVDERSIEDVRPDDLKGYTQCHFFAGIGIWSYALRRAGWPDDKRIWTASCPCQPFSAAGKGLGFADERHLWPAFFHLVSQCRPERIFGEQVASSDGLAWLDLVQADLEAADYAFGAVDLCAAGVGAPHIRQRLYWVADADYAGLEGRDVLRERAGQRAIGANGMASGLADSDSAGFYSGSVTAASAGYGHTTGPAGSNDQSELPGPTNGFWRAADWLACTDGKWRPVEPGTFPLATGVANRVGRLRAYGNGLCAEVAAAFIRCCP